MPIPLVFLDPVQGSDTNTGAKGSPMRTLAASVAAVMEGGTVLVVSPGDVGPLSASGRSLRIKSLPALYPTVPSLSCQESSVILEGLTLPAGASISNSLQSGVAIFRDCKFPGRAGVDLSRVKYVSMHQNRLDSCSSGIIITEAEEASIGANVISNVLAPVSANKVRLMDFYHNTVHGCGELYFDDFGSGVAFNIAYLTVTPAVLAAKRVYLNGVPLAVAVNMSTGSAQEEGLDYVVSGHQVSWAGLGLEDDLEIGDVLRISYEAQGQGSGVTEGRMRLDSNSLSSNDAGVHFSSGDYVEVTHNNLFGTPAIGGTQAMNIVTDPMYADLAGFTLDPLSPNKDAANSDRWTDAFLRTAPYDKDRDFTGAELTFVEGAPLSDMGAREVLGDQTVRTSDDVSVAQDGHDSVGSGDPTKPLLTLSKAYQAANGDTISVHVHGTTGVSHSRAVLGTGTVSLTESALGATGGHSPEVLLRASASSDSPSSAAYVSEEGSDAATGTRQDPYRTIAHALSLSDAVLVEPGHYTAFLGATGKSVTPIDSLRTMQFGQTVEAPSSYTWDVVQALGATGSISIGTVHIKHF